MQIDSDQQIRLAMVGFGLIGQRHAEALKAAPRVKLAAVVEPTGGASDAAADLSVTVFSDITQMLDDSRPDMVIIVSPTTLHFAHARHCVEAGVSTLK